MIGVLHVRILRVAFIVVALPLLLYLLAFAWRFEIFGCPVRDEMHGWLGPRVRGDVHCIDIGKVWYREAMTSLPIPESFNRWFFSGCSRTMCSRAAPRDVEAVEK